jgi:hypothetical protein
MVMMSNYLKSKYLTTPTPLYHATMHLVIFTHHGDGWLLVEVGFKALL